MPEYSDIYVISNKRTKEVALSFLDSFIPNREESADDYHIPQFSENKMVIDSQLIKAKNY